MSDSKEQMDAVALILGTLEKIRSFGQENFEPVASKSALVSSKLMRKPDQVSGSLPPVTVVRISYLEECCD